ncbi:hypothetical protein AVEN_271404-1 [Araneus ventricosus]|uniref:Uncharacterized protein n=1 Tax=Araneus ventricosus TaxID=182803 RepID=A0A4Y2IWB6_ARAVE|nr:hypothetical protein AVEN_271404-1 [Araneus ventricosus]
MGRRSVCDDQGDGSESARAKCSESPSTLEFARDDYFVSVCMHDQGGGSEYAGAKCSESPSTLVFATDDDFRFFLHAMTKGAEVSLLERNAPRVLRL